MINAAEILRLRIIKFPAIAAGRIDRRNSQARLKPGASNAICASARMNPRDVRNVRQRRDIIRQV